MHGTMHYDRPYYIIHSTMGFQNISDYYLSNRRETRSDNSMEINSRHYSTCGWDIPGQVSGKGTLSSRSPTKLSLAAKHKKIPVAEI
jgi:hypothetical protein